MHIEIKSDWMGVKTTGRRCEVSPKTVRRWLEQGLPFFQVTPRSKILIKPGDVDVFLKRRRKTQVDLDGMVDQAMGELQSCNDLGAAGVRRH